MTELEIAVQAQENLGTPFAELSKTQQYQCLAIVAEGGDSSQFGEEVKKILAEPLVETVKFIPTPEKKIRLEKGKEIEIPLGEATGKPLDGTFTVTDVDAEKKSVTIDVKPKTKPKAKKAKK